MAAHGEIGPMPDCAIFADTQDEGMATYQHLERLRSILPFPVSIVTHGRLSEALFAGDDEARCPAFVKGSGLSVRQCTRNFKIRPIKSEEHTSELQSLMRISYAVFCLKKKKTTKPIL